MMNNNKELNLDELKNVAGGNSLRDFPHYEKIKEFYKNRGAGDAVTLCGKYGLGVEDSYALVSMIADEVKREAEQMTDNISF